MGSSAPIAAGRSRGHIASTLARLRPSQRLTAVLLHGAVLLVPLLGAKIHKIVQVAPDVGSLELASVVGPDLLFLLVYCVVFGVLLRVRSLAAQRIVGGLLALSTLALGGVTVLEHGFFLSTGALLDWPLVIHGVEQWADLRGVVVAAVPPVVYGALGAMLVATAATAVVVWRSLPWGEPAPLSYGRMLLAALLLVAGCTGSLPSIALPGPLVPLRANIFASFGGQILAGGTSGAGEAVVVPVEPVELAPRSGGASDWNVVIVVLESTRARSTTPYDPSLDTMPFLAELARRGALAENAYTTVPHTTKAMVPIHCGVYPKLVVRNDEAREGALPVECLPTLLHHRGYATALFQSVDEAYESGDGLARALGFGTYRGKESLPHEGFDECSYFGYEDDILLGPSLEWVDQQKGPFLLSFLTVTPHHDYRVPRGFERKRLSDDPDMDGYLNTLRYLDRFLRKLYAGFEERGLLDRTVFVVIGDHGEGFGEHGRRQHDTVIYDEGLEIPLVVVGPGVAPGQRIGGLRQNIDVVPTVLELLGLRIVHGELPGRSLLSTDGHERLHHSCHYEDHCMALRQGSRKVVYHYGKRPTEVFELKADPLERRDLVGAKVVSAG